MAERKKKTESSFAKATADKPETDLSSYLSEGFSDAPLPSIDSSKEGVIESAPLGSANLLDQPSFAKATDGKRAYTKRKKKDGDEDGDPIIDGEMLVEFIDIFIPALISMIHNNFVKDGVKISPDELDATEKQKAKMIKFANRVAEKLNMDVNPFVGLAVTMVGCYGMKYFQAKNK